MPNKSFLLELPISECFITAMGNVTKILRNQVNTFRIIQSSLHMAFSMSFGQLGQAGLLTNTVTP